MGSDWELFERLEDRAVESPDSLGPGFHGVVAVDVWRQWGAVYRLTVASDGEWSSDIELAQRRPDGTWEFFLAGGSHGDGWPANWRPEIESAARLDAGELVGRDVEDDDGSDIELVARTGYAAPGVEAVLVQLPHETRTVPVFARLNAFVILGPAGRWSLTALGAEGALLGPPLDIDTAE